MKKLEQAVYYLLRNREFYAHFYLQSTIKVVQNEPKTACAGIDKNGIYMKFNEQFLEKFKVEEVAAIIEHEILHILLNHLPSMKDKDLHKNIANIAMDLEINQYIPNIPKESITLTGIEKLIKKNLLPNQTWEYYYNEIHGYAEQLPEWGQNGSEGPTDEHNGGDGRDGISDAERHAFTKSASDRAVKTSRGNVPENLLKVLEGLNRESVVPWQQVLSAFVARSVSSVIQNTKKKIHRRFKDLNVPGKKKKRELVLGIAADVSGSVSDEQYAMFLAEINKVSDLCNKIYFVQADCEVQSFETLSKNKKPKLERNGCGGTAYQPAIDKLKELKCDAMIYFGDMDSADKPENPGKPFLWVIVGNQNPPGDFGGQIRI